MRAVPGRPADDVLGRLLAASADPLPSLAAELGEAWSRARIVPFHSLRNSSLPSSVEGEAFTPRLAAAKDVDDTRLLAGTRRAVPRKEQTMPSSRSADSILNGCAPARGPVCLHSNGF